MERWPICLLLALVVPSVARADPPTTVVVFGTPADRLSIVDPPLPEPRPAVEPAAAARTDRACPPPVTLVRRFGGRRERIHMPLLDCDGMPREEARRAVSLLARPRSIEQRPSEARIRAFRSAGGDPEMLAPGVRLVHPALLDRLQRIGEAFHPHAIEIVSGYRPESPARSRHHHARALDLFVEGVEREAVRDLAVTFPQTGVGWYPNSTFVHVDVREESAYWVDLSGPGERPRYVRGATPPSTPANDAPPRQGDSSDGPRAEPLSRVRREMLDALRAIRVPEP